MGFPKCGSTYVQEVFFPHHPDIWYLGKRNPVDREPPSIIEKLKRALMPEPCWRRLRLLRETIKNRKSAKYFLNQIHEEGTPVLTPMDEQILSELRDREFKSVLEVGTGGGRLTYSFAYHGYQVVGIEPDKWYRNLVNQFVEKRGLSNCEIIDGDIHDIPYPDRTFDIVVCRAVIEHVQNPDIAVSELVRCARILCIVSTPFGFESDSPGHIHHFFDDDIDRIFKPYNYSKQKLYDRPGGNKVFLITVQKS